MDNENIMKEDMKKFAKSTKNKALALTIAVAFAISNPLALTGCQPKDPDQEEEQQSSGGSGVIIHGGTSGSRKSSITSGGSSKSSWANPSHSGGYSASHGGSSG